MLELVLVVAVVGVLGLVAVVAMTLTANALAAIGGVLLALGLALGIPTGFWYHVVLYHIVAPRVALPRRWWWAPSALHRHLSEAERGRIAPWYRIGGVGFVLCVVGGGVALLGLLVGR